MRRTTPLWAFGATALALGLVVWLALVGRAQTSNDLGFVVPGTEAHHAVVTVRHGETLRVYGLNQSMEGPALTLTIQFVDAGGFELSRQMCDAAAGGFCSARFTTRDCRDRDGCQVRAIVTVQPPSAPPGVDGGIPGGVAGGSDGGAVTPTSLVWSTTQEVINRRGESTFVSGPIANFFVGPSGPVPGTDG